MLHSAAIRATRATSIRMAGNTLVRLFCVTSFGESHGPAIGCVVASSAVMYVAARRSVATTRLAAVMALAALFVPPVLTAASVVVLRPNVAAPLADMTALVRPPDDTAPAREARQEIYRQKLLGYLTANRGDATYLVVENLIHR